MLPITYTGGHDPFLGSRQAIAFRHMFSNVHQQISTRIIIIKGHFWVRGVTCVGGGKYRRPHGHGRQMTFRLGRSHMQKHNQVYIHALTAL